MTQQNNDQIHPSLKVRAGFSPDAPDEEVRKYVDDVFPDEIEKPCGILLWCPYGELVEDFPLHTTAIAYAIEHGKYVRWDDTPHGLRPDGTQYAGRWVTCAPGEKDAQPDIGFAIGKVDEPWSCGVYGHDCPAFHVAEPFADPEAVADRWLCDECQTPGEKPRDAGEASDAQDVGQD